MDPPGAVRGGHLLDRVLPDETGGVHRGKCLSESDL